MYAKPFWQGQKNDLRDALAVAEVGQRPTIGFSGANARTAL
jgi:hypothetical protein